MRPVYVRYHDRSEHRTRVDQTVELENCPSIPECFFDANFESPRHSHVSFIHDLCALPAWSERRSIHVSSAWVACSSTTERRSVDLEQRYRAEDCRNDTYTMPYGVRVSPISHVLRIRVLLIVGSDTHEQRKGDAPKLHPLQKVCHLPYPLIATCGTEAETSSMETTGRTEAVSKNLPRSFGVPSAMKDDESFTPFIKKVCLPPLLRL